MSTEMDSSRQKFIRLCESIFELCGDLQDGDFVDCGLPLDLVLLLNIESASLKASGGISTVPVDILTRVMGILEKYVHEGAELLPIVNNSVSHEELDALWAAINAALTMANIMTSYDVPQQVYFGNVIKTIVLLIKYQLENTVYPFFDSGHLSSDSDFKENIDLPRKKSGKVKSREVEKHTSDICGKLNELLGLVTDVVDTVTLGDEVIASLCVMGVRPFFMDNVRELQQTANRLVTGLFCKYANCRSLMMDQIFKLVGCISVQKRNQRTYAVDSTAVMTFTALTFNLIQSVVWLPDPVNCATINADDLVMANYKTAMTVTSSFLTLFLNKSMTKNEEKVFRPLLDNFVQDLITTLHKPEWPVSEMIISQLGRSLIANFTSKHLDASIRATSIEVLGMLASQMRETEIVQREKFGSILQLLQSGRDKDEEDGPKKKKNKGKPKAKKEKAESLEVVDNVEKTCLDDYSIQDFHEILLGFLAHRHHLDSSRCFHIVQWFRDTMLFTCKPKEDKELALVSKDTKTKGRKGKSSKAAALLEVRNSEVSRLSEQHKEFLITNRQSTQDEESSIPSILYDDFVTISHYLVSRRHSPATRNFEIYLQQTLGVLGDSSIQIRTKALKSLRLMVDADPSLLSRPDVKSMIDMKFLDTSPAVREATVDFIGKFVTTQPNLFSDYYEALSTRILDSSLGVRKRIVRIFRDICVGQPSFPNLPQLCLNMIGRLADEEGIRRFVVEAFESLWFAPVGGRDAPQQLRQRVRDITAAIGASPQGQHLFELLLNNLFNSKEQNEMRTSKSWTIACSQIIEELVRNVLQPRSGEGISRPPVIPSYVTLHTFAKVKPELLTKHFNMLQHYLSTASTREPCEAEVVSIVARTIELIIPLLRDADISVFTKLEADCLKIVRCYNPSIVNSIIPCLSTIVKTVTKNYALIHDFFGYYYRFLDSYKNTHGHLPNAGLPDNVGNTSYSYLQRSLFIVGILLRHFNFTSSVEPVSVNAATTSTAPATANINTSLKAGCTPSTEDVFNTVMFYVQRGSSLIQRYGVMALGNLCLFNREYLLHPQVKQTYKQVLTGGSDDSKAQVLCNIEHFLLEEERRLTMNNRQWKLQSHQENLKEMCDVSTGMASTVVQIHLQEITATYASPSPVVRQAAWRLVHQIVRQGLINVCQILHILIAMSTDLSAPNTATSSRKMLHEINLKFPSFVLMKAMAGICFSYDLQKVLKVESKEVVRGYIKLGNDTFEATNDALYLLVRPNKQQRRALALRMLKCFDESQKNNLFQLVYIADNLAYFSYQSLDEPMFVIHHINMILSISGNNTLDDYQQAFIPVNGNNQQPNEEEPEDIVTIINRIPEDLNVLRTCIASTHGYLLLLSLKQHLKQMYGITDIKLHRYLPTDGSKGFEKPVMRRNCPEFRPEATLQVLQGQMEKSPIRDLLDWFDKQKVAEQYLDFKQLMEDTDPNDMESIAYADKKIADFYQLVANRSPNNMEEPLENKLKPADLPVKLAKPVKKRRQSLEDTTLLAKKVAVPRGAGKTMKRKRNSAP